MIYKQAAVLEDPTLSIRGRKITIKPILMTGRKRKKDDKHPVGLSIYENRKHSGAPVKDATGGLYLNQKEFNAATSKAIVHEADGMEAIGCQKQIVQPKLHWLNGR